MKRYSAFLKAPVLLTDCLESYPGPLLRWGVLTLCRDAADRKQPFVMSHEVVHIQILTLPTLMDMREVSCINISTIPSK